MTSFLKFALQAFFLSNLLPSKVSSALTFEQAQQKALAFASREIESTGHVGNRDYEALLRDKQIATFPDADKNEIKAILLGSYKDDRINNSIGVLILLAKLGMNDAWLQKEILDALAPVNTLPHLAEALEALARLDKSDAQFLNECIKKADGFELKAKHIGLSIDVFDVVSKLIEKSDHPMEWRAVWTAKIRNKLNTIQEELKTSRKANEKLLRERAKVLEADLERNLLPLKSGEEDVAQRDLEELIITFIENTDNKPENRMEAALALLQCKVLKAISIQKVLLFLQKSAVFPALDENITRIVGIKILELISSGQLGAFGALACYETAVNALPVSEKPSAAKKTAKRQ